MKKSLFLVSLILLINSCKEERPNQEIWQPLFNGKDLSDWEIKFANHEINFNLNNTFRVQDSMIRISYDDYNTFDDSYAHIYYNKPFSYYKLRFDYRFLGNQVSGGETWNIRNSGIMLHSQSARSNDFGQFFPVSIEIQLLGGLGKEMRTTGNLCTPGTAVEIDGKINYQHCIKSTSATYHGNQWVRGEVIVLGGESITHLIENDTVLKYQLPQIGGGFTNPRMGDQDWFSRGVKSKDYWIAKEGEVLINGYIALQAESHPIDFKNIEILNLCGCMDPKAKNYKSYFVKADDRLCIY